MGKVIKLPRKPKPQVARPVPASKREKARRKRIAKEIAKRSTMDLVKVEKPTGTLLKRRAKDMRATPTRAERRMSERLTEAGIPHECQVVLGWYIADIAIPERMRLIEVDGSHHYSPEGEVRDYRRTVWLKQFGFQILRVPNELVERFCLDEVLAFALVTIGVWHKAVAGANKSRNRALYYPPEQQERYKSKRKKASPAWARVPRVDARGRIIRKGI